MNRNKKPAYSLIYALLIMVTIMMVSATSIQNTTEKIRIFNDLEAGSQARLLAESAAELGVQAMKNKNPGYEVIRENAFDDGTSSGDYYVYSKASSNTVLGGSDTFIPMPNTGTAAPASDCNILDNHKNPDHACNWNKLTIGESAAIPLYADNGFSAIDNPNDLGLTAWYLRVRTPCKNGSLEEDCAGGSRYILDEGTTLAEDASVIFWQMIAETSYGETLGMVPEDHTIDIIGNEIRDPNINTEVYESLINSPSTYGSLDNIVLEASNAETRYQEILDFCLDSTIQRLTMQLDIVSPLIDEATGLGIPYLEWQLVTNSTDPFADNKAAIIGKGYYEGLSGTYYFPYVIVKPTVGENNNIYTLSN